MFLEILQNSLENTCTRVSFIKRLCHRCFLANFAKSLRTAFLQNTSGRLLLYNLSTKKYGLYSYRQSGVNLQELFCGKFYLWAFLITSNTIRILLKEISKVWLAAQKQLYQANSLRYGTYGVRLEKQSPGGVL